MSSRPKAREFAAAFLLVGFCAPAGAQPVRGWDGTWAGMLNKTEPVSITVMGGKVVGYTIQGFSPLTIERSVVTANRISLSIGPSYHVSITRISQRAAYGIARGPLGAGTASLSRE